MTSIAKRALFDPMVAGRLGGIVGLDRPSWAATEACGDAPKRVNNEAHVRSPSSVNIGN